MRSLADLLATADGAAFLEDRGVLTDPDAFVTRLRPPARSDLAELLGVSVTRPLVYVGQQVTADMALPTAAKFGAARELAGQFDVTPAVLWHDMDSARSERYGARFVLPRTTKSHGVWLVPRRRVESADVEPRFLSIDRAVLETAFAELSAWTVDSSAVESDAAGARVARLAAAALADGPTTLAQVERAIVSFLLAEEVGLEAPSVFASEMISAGLLVDEIQEYLLRLDDVVCVFNEAVAELVARDIDPQVRELEADYLPLRFSCPDDDMRLRLTREQRRGGVFAVADCRCGKTFAFPLGMDGASLDDLAATARWSIDVSMPVHHNALASGWIAGRSTALYVLVLNEVIRRVFDREPLPVLVPTELVNQESNAETLLVQHLARAGRRLVTT